jgi:hypothetical protein
MEVGRNLEWQITPERFDSRPVDAMRSPSGVKTPEGEPPFGGVKTPPYKDNAMPANGASKRYDTNVKRKAPAVKAAAT